ncbi:sugar kinase [Gilvimarinus polysaccharolyticus]|uniref:sugar kinase n=1 Tax=Gilvimarinus polysaccharolyticus TaxID=863921 RepID=UPI000673B0B4|nr:sugar kinase [Gilvimarinus polysaccharolyticus]
MAKIACIGEVMIELAASESTTNGREYKALSYAGDTYNTAVTLARLAIDTTYVTRLGDDHYSDAIIARLQAENINTQAIVHQEGAVPGLYMIHNSPDGEREFFYWRSQAPARAMFSQQQEIAQLETALNDCEMIYLSGITLAIISTEARQQLLAFLRRFKKHGGKVAFDSNYRPRLWQTPEQAQQAMNELLSVTDLALLTLDDEELLWGDDDDAIEAVKLRYANYGIAEIVLKRGAEDVIILNGNQQTRVAVPRVENIVDTTAAGDTFNAGYLAARSTGKSAEAAAAQACRCARVIIQHRGGVIDRELYLNELANA